MRILATSSVAYILIRENSDFEIYQRLESLVGLDLRNLMLRFGPEAPVEFGKAVSDCFCQCEVV